MGTNRLHGLRWAARAHRLVARALRRSKGVADRHRVRGRGRDVQPLARSRFDAAGDLLRLARRRAGRRRRGRRGVHPPGTGGDPRARGVFLGSPPDWVRGAGAGAGAAVAAVAVHAGLGLVPESWRRSPAHWRWIAYAALGGVAAATLGPWLVLVLIGCGAVEVALQNVERARRASVSTPGRSPPRPRATDGRSVRVGLGRVQGRRALVRRRLRDHPAHAGRRRPRLPLDDEHGVPQRGRARSDHPGPGDADRRRRRVRGLRHRGRSAGRARRVRTVVLVRAPRRQALRHAPAQHGDARVSRRRRACGHRRHHRRGDPARASRSTNRGSTRSSRPPPSRSSCSAAASCSPCSSPAPSASSPRWSARRCPRRTGPGSSCRAARAARRRPR